MSTTIKQRHQKQLSKMHRTLQLRGFGLAEKALSFVQSLETGKTRKDKVTPKLHHQVSVARLVYTLGPHLLYLEETLAAAFLHDVPEDHGDLRTEGLVEDFGIRVIEPVMRLTKKHRGQVKTYETYFAEMATCPIASIVKLSDRAHNIQTMQGVFTPDKQRAYVEEVSTWFFPLIREARQRHPQQYDAYENLKILLRCQVALLRQVLAVPATPHPARVFDPPPAPEVPHVDHGNRSLVYGSDGHGPLK